MRDRQLTAPRRGCSNPVVPVRRIAARISIIAVAIAVALAVPVSQLRTIAIVKTCCCPDPSHCHCPDHKTDPSPQPSMRACHSTQHAIAAPQLPSFASPMVAVAADPPVAVAAVEHAIHAPHSAPPPARPDAPS